MIDNQDSVVLCIIFNQELNCLLVGYFNGYLIQYQQNTFNSWKVQNNYGYLKLGSIYSIACSGNIAVVGGECAYIQFINIRTYQIIAQVPTAIKLIFSLQFCPVHPFKQLLTVGGLLTDYSQSKTDLFDVSPLFKL